MSAPFDLFVIGGGINGTGIARDAAGRGLKVALCEKDDLGEGTSSRSSKLIHGGLRYLEYGELRLVRESLIEREVLLGIAPHIIWPLRFVLPHSAEQRPAWLIRTGLFLYDHLSGRRRLPGTQRLDLRREPEGAPLRQQFRTAFAYSDCWVNDARLVVLNALDARERGAEVLVRNEAVVARRADGLWVVTVRAPDGSERDFRARALVNAAGPWVERVIRQVVGSNTARHVRLVKGSHLVVAKFWDGPQAYLFQNDDKRVIFVSPYEDDFGLIGTTDVPFEGAPERVASEVAERDYLLGAVNRYVRRPLRPEDVLHSFSGVRPLDDDRAANPSAVTRDYAFEVDGAPPLLSVFGGKLTTYRRLAERALDRLAPSLRANGQGPCVAWTGTAPLPGGDMPDADFDSYCRTLGGRFLWLDPGLVRHYARSYGTRAEALLDGARSRADLGRHFGGRLYEREADYLIRHEWARRAEDVLERRTKHHLHMTAAECEGFADWMAKAA